MSDKFTVTYYADDGYLGRDRPLKFKIDPSDIDESMDDDELRELFFEMVQNDFEQRVSAETSQSDDFITWAKKVIADQVADPD